MVLTCIICGKQGLYDVAEVSMDKHGNITGMICAECVNGGKDADTE